MYEFLDEPLCDLLDDHYELYCDELRDELFEGHYDE
jgi:hypothetical protein